MDQPLCIRVPILSTVLTFLLLSASSAVAEKESADCTQAPNNHVQLALSDQNSRTHLQVVRRIDAGASLNLEVCDAELTVKEGKDDSLRITVDFGNGTPEFPAADYLQALDFEPNMVRVKLHLPKQPRAKVLVVVAPSTASLQLNLVRGDLSLETDRIAGERRINVVSGHVKILANPDSYGRLDASVLFGSFHDRRKGGEQGHGMVSKSLVGTGKGSINVSVVRGSLVLAAWD